MDRAYN